MGKDFDRKVTRQGAVFREAVIGPDHGKKETILIANAGRMSKGSPFHIFPLTGKGEMDSHIQARILIQHPYCFREPGTGYHDFNGANDSLLERLNTTQVCSMGGPYIIGPDYKACFLLGLS